MKTLLRSTFVALILSVSLVAVAANCPKPNLPGMPPIPSPMPAPVPPAF